MEEELERQYQEQMEEEKLINDEMLHDEEIALEKQKEKLENPQGSSSFTGAVDGT